MKMTKNTKNQRFKEKATSSEISSFITSLEKLMKNGKMNSQVFAAFKKDLEKTRELKRQYSAERQKQLEKDKKLAKMLGVKKIWKEGDPIVIDTLSIYWPVF